MTDPTDYAALIAQLEADRDEIEVTIAVLRRRSGLASSTDLPNGDRSISVRDGAQGRDTAVIVGRVRSDEFFRLSMSEAIAKYIGIMKQPQTPVVIVSGLKAGGLLTNAKNLYASVNTELKRMRERGIVVNTPSGWGLAEWYPSKPRLQESAKPKPKKRAKAKAAKAGDPTKRTAYNTFISERRAAGLSLSEAAAEWSASKADKTKAPTS